LTNELNSSFGEEWIAFKMILHDIIKVCSFDTVTDLIFRTIYQGAITNRVVQEIFQRVF